MDLSGPLRSRGGLAAALLLVGGCATAPAPLPDPVAIRLLGSGGSGFVPVDALARPVDVEVIPLGTGNATRWRSVGGRVVERPSEVETDPRERIAWIEVDIDRDAAGFSRIVLEGEVGGGVRTELFWSTRERGWTPDQSISPGATPGHRSGEVVVLDLADRPSWTGWIGKVRIGLQPGGSADPTRLSRLVLRRFELLPSRPGEPRSGEVELRGDLREARLLRPGEPFDAVVTVPAGGRLSFSSGLAVGAGSTRVRALAVEPSKPVELLSEATPAAGRGWRDESVDLARWAGRTVTIRFEALAPPGEEPGRSAAWLAGPVVVPGGARRGKPNVLLVSIDTLRADRLSIFGAERETSPRIDRWARGAAVRFERAIASAPWTLPSHLSLFSGREAIRHGIQHPNAVLPGSMELLAERFRAGGWATAAVTGGGRFHPRYGFSRGFERYAHFSGNHREEELEWELGRAMEFLGQDSGRPFFLFLHTYEVHDPYRERHPHYERLGGRPAPEGMSTAQIRLRFDGADSGGGVGPPSHSLRWLDGPRDGQPLAPAELPLARDRYDSEIAHVDEAFGSILDRLAALGLADDTIVALVSDHGEAFGEEGNFGHGYLDESNVRVPMLVSFPDRRGAGRAIDRQVRLVDVAPTLLEAAGLPPLPGIEGRSLLPLLGDGAPPPREAFTYASHLSLGVALRTARGTVEFDNSAWPGAWGRTRFRPAPGDEAPEAGERAALEAALVERVRGELERHLAGFRLVMRAAAGEPLSGVASLPGLEPAMVKADDAGCRCLSFVPPSGIAFALPPGGRQEVILEFPPREAIEFRLAPEGEGTGPARLELDASTPRHLVRRDGGWEAGEGPLPAGEAGFELRWQGEVLPSRDEPVGDDPALRERLRALGYLR